MRDVFVSALSNAASSVAVVTTAGHMGMAGSTISSFCSVSADPPMLLACVHKLSPLADTIQANGRFCLNLLSQQQTRESDVFAGRIKPQQGDKFSLVDWTKSTSGQPMISHSLASFDCEVSQVIDGASHWVVFGLVTDVYAHDDSDTDSSLVYCQRAYAGTTRLISFAAA
jgi:flavin reductase|tara:strand:+ start:136 stop:645 length:510 start_codon:yes stop_codon:yes gene_type:complete